MSSPATVESKTEPMVLALSLLSDDDAKEPMPEGRDSWRQPAPRAYPLSVVKMARSVFAPGKTYRMRCIRTATITASGGGLLQLATSVAPSGFAEYSALSALFTECRLRSTRIHLTFYSSGATPIIAGYCSSFDPSNYSTAPTFTYACQMPGAKLWNTFGPLSGEHVNEYTPRTLRPWSQVTASGSGTDPVGGIIGTWYHSLSRATTASADVGVYLLECDYEFRNPL